MSSRIAVLLHRFLDVYQREPDALERALDSPDWVFTDEIPILEQAAILAAADQEVQRELLGRTLIDTIGFVPRHSHLQREIGDSREMSNQVSAQDLMADLRNIRMLELEKAESEGLPVELYRVNAAKRELSSQVMSTEVLRFFADQTDSIVAAFRQLDNKNFDEFVPDGLRNLIKECHLNFALGHKATTCILCGAILERSLKDKLDSGDSFGKLLAKAGEQGVLANKKDLAAASIIYKARTDAIHGNPDFEDMKSEKVLLIIQVTRELVAKLYGTSHMQ
jgi:hypothetical protein